MNIFALGNLFMYALCSHYPIEGFLSFLFWNNLGNKLVECSVYGELQKTGFNYFRMFRSVRLSELDRKKKKKDNKKRSEDTQMSHRATCQTSKFAFTSA